METDHKKNIIQQQISVMSAKLIGNKIYNSDVVIRSFEYFSTSRALYNQLRNDFQLPSVSTLTRITSKVSKINDASFLNSVFTSIEGRKRVCIVIHDEVYVKKMMLYHGGTLFGKSLDDPSLLAKTVLGIMVVCLKGGPKFLYKMIPISKLNSNFLFEQINSTLRLIKESSGDVKVVICDGNRVNQAFFKLYLTISGKPWVTEDGMYLLFDFVHLLKHIRNLWLREKTGELVYSDNGIQRTAKWEHLKCLYKLESEKLVKLSDLNEVAIAPKPIERQSVSTCLRVFSDKTYHALLSHSQINSNSKDTAIFINKVITWWKTLNVKGCGADVRHNDPLKAPICSPDDYRLNTLLQFGDMALEMCCKKGTRVRQLSNDTAKVIHHTCYGTVEL